MYKITLTDAEYNDLASMRDRGYDCGMFEAIGTIVSANLDGTEATYRIAEHLMWGVRDQYNEAIEGGNDPWGPFVAESLRPKLDALIAEVV